MFLLYRYGGQLQTVHQPVLVKSIGPQQTPTQRGKGQEEIPVTQVQSHPTQRVQMEWNHPWKPNTDCVYLEIEYRPVGKCHTHTFSPPFMANPQTELDQSCAYVQ